MSNSTKHKVHWKEIKEKLICFILFSRAKEIVLSNSSELELKINFLYLKLHLIDCIQEIKQ